MNQTKGRLVVAHIKSTTNEHNWCSTTQSLIKCSAPPAGGEVQMNTNESINYDTLIQTFLLTIGDETSLTLGKSPSDTLCMLFRVTAIGAADLGSINSDSSLSDFNIVPVARSYNSNNWDHLAGPYAQELLISCADDPAVQCLLEIPVLANLKEGRFVLLPFQHSLSDSKSVVSRFFHQTTFGPTISMIKAWDYSKEVDTEFASWVENQMDQSSTPITSHREYFRKRVNGELNQNQEATSVDIMTGRKRQIFKARHPCEKGARWVKYSFTKDDENKKFKVTSNTDGMWLVEDEDGIARTLLTSFTDTDDNGFRAGYYLVGKQVDEMLGGRLSKYISSP